MKIILQTGVKRRRGRENSRYGIGRLCALAQGIIIICCLTGCSRQPVAQQSMDTAMGTVIQQTIYTTNGDANTAKEILACIDSLERDSLSWRMESAEVYRINQSAGSELGSEMSPKLKQIILDCQEVSIASGGAFDLTIGKAARLWDIDNWAVAEDISEFVIPSEEEIAEALAETGYEKISLADNHIFLLEHLQLDLGAVGKGIALDEIKELLEQREDVVGAVIAVGGSVLTYGSKAQAGTSTGNTRSEDSWKVGVADPFDTGKFLGTLSLTGQWCVSTSGDYERYVEVDGVRYHHIMDPATGRPAESGVKGVTVLSKSGLYSDALSTACFVLGEEEGRMLAEQFDAEVLFVSDSGEITMTEGMEQYFQLSKEGK